METKSILASQISVSVSGRMQNVTGEAGSAPLISFLREISNERVTSSLVKSASFNTECKLRFLGGCGVFLYSSEAFKQNWFPPQAACLRLVSRNVKNQRLAAGFIYLQLIATISAASKFQTRNFSGPGQSSLYQIALHFSARAQLSVLSACLRATKHSEAFSVISHCHDWSFLAIIKRPYTSVVALKGSS